MDVSMTASAMNAAQGGSAVGIKMLKTAQDQEASQASQLVQSIGQAPNMPGQGQNIDLNA